MSALAVDSARATPSLRPMRETDLDEVMRIELRAYPFPWTMGIFRDCLRAGYPAWVLWDGAAIYGYGVISVAVGEAHVLNVCIDPPLHGRGYGRRLMHAIERVARAEGAQRLYLEVRPSNPHAIALYHDEGFNEIGRRPRYYPAQDGREDAIVMAKELLSDDIARMPTL